MSEEKKLGDNQAEMSLAFEILPVEIWEKIFNYLKGSPSDLATCMNTCGQWYNLLKSERTTFLFPEVFKILADSKEVDWMLERKRRFDEDDAKQPLTKTRLLSYRLVSKAWNDAILNFIQWHPSHFQLEELTSGGNNSYSLGQQSWQRDSYKWYHRVMLEEFLQTFGDTCVDKNPFVTRRLSIIDFNLYRHEFDEEYNVQVQTFYRLVTRLLEIFGDHLWHFHIDVSACLTSSSYYVLLQSWLTLMPNLKTLRIRYNPWALNEDDADYIWLWRSIGNMIEATPLPVLKNLTLLELSWVPPPLALCLLEKYEDSLERLGIDCFGVLNQLKGVPEPLYKIPEMTCLKTASIMLNYEIELLALEKALVSRECANIWPLESLHIGYNQPRVLDEDRTKFDVAPSWDSLFRFVNLFKDTLTELRLDLPRASNDWEKQRIYRRSSRLLYNLQLPKLKKLKVQFWNRTSIDFLLPLKSLEELEILKRENEPVPPMAISKLKTLRSGRKIWIQKKPSEIIKFNGLYTNYMSMSNIWEKLPNLRMLTVECKRPKNPHCHVRLRHVYTVKGR